MKLINPFTILNQNFHEMDLIREAMNKRILATENFIKTMGECIERTNLLIST